MKRGSGFVQLNRLRDQRNCDLQFGLSVLGDFSDEHQMQKLQELQDELDDAQERLNLTRALLRRQGSVAGTATTATSDQTPAATSVHTPTATSVHTPAATSVHTPAATSVHTPVATSVRTPATTSIHTPAATSVRTSAEQGPGLVQVPSVQRSGGGSGMSGRDAASEKSAKEGSVIADRLPEKTEGQTIPNKNSTETV